MYSRDPKVRCIATTETLKEQLQTKAPFKPFHTVVDAMKDDPGASKAATTTKAKVQVQAADTAYRLSHTSDLVVQEQTVRAFEGKEAATWSTVVLSLPERVFKFALNTTTDTLPHNQNLAVLVAKDTLLIMPPVRPGPDTPPRAEQLPCSLAAEEIQQEARRGPWFHLLLSF